MSVVCFHNPDEENGPLSNWYPSRFVWAGEEFASLEQYMMYRKAVCFGDADSAAKIMDTDDPAVAKALGRAVSGYDDRLWDGIRQIVVYEGLLAKFAQNEHLGDLLRSTGSALLAECSVQDRIWGIGLSMADPERFDPAQWRGRNLLGYTLMMVRDRL